MMANAGYGAPMSLELNMDAIIWLLVVNSLIMWASSKSYFLLVSFNTNVRFHASTLDSLQLANQKCIILEHLLVNEHVNQILTRANYKLICRHSKQFLVMTCD